MTELRRRMDDAMVVRGMADRTRETYLRAVTGLARHYHRSPDVMSDAEVQAYLLHLIRDRQRSWSTCNITVNALRFLYHTTLKRDRTTFCVPSPRQPGTLPVILSREEIERLIAHAANPKDRTMLLTIYAAGLRLNEVLHLRVTDIDSARMTIRVEQGKGGKDRYTVLSRRLLETLRTYGKTARPPTWLCPSQDTGQPLHPTALQRVSHLAKLRAGITKPGGIHGLRHACATHLLEAGVDSHTIQRLLGHAYIGTTTRSFQLTRHTEMGPDSPLDHCGAVRVTDNSCRNRHCPKCQTLTTARWLAARKADLLPIPYFHIVFTLPHGLNALAQGNPRVLYALLFRAAAATLLTFGRDPRHLGGTVGITAILHTWGQALTPHLHLHGLVTGGALAADRSRWMAGRSSFPFPVRALSPVFRATYLAGLQRAFDTGQLTFAGGTAALADRRAFTRCLGQLRAVDWIVYAKRPFAGPEQVLDYLGRYTHRGALSNDRLVDHRDGRVHFRWKDDADHDRVKVMALDADDFLRRFLLHVVPRGFMRIRPFGLLANRTRRGTLTQCRDLVGQRPLEDVSPESSAALLQRLTGVDLSRCPVCGEGRMQITAMVVHEAPPPATS